MMCYLEWKENIVFDYLEVQCGFRQPIVDKYGELTPIKCNTGFWSL